MKSKEALLKLCFKYLPTIDDMHLILDEEDEELLKVIQRDLEILYFIKTHYEMNGFNELIPLYLDYDDEKFNKIGEWLENEKIN